MARPKKNIDPELVEKLASIFCTMEDMSLILDCSVDTLERRFAEVIKKGRSKSKASLRRKQYEVAQSGNVTMLIWLGKQHLDQSDKREETVKDVTDYSKNQLPTMELIKLARGEWEE
jgi:hypothetical protein